MGSSRVTSPVSQTRLRCELGSKRHGAQLLLDANLAQDFHGVGHHLDAGADAHKARGLLIDAHIEANTTQSRRDSQASHARADNSNG